MGLTRVEARTGIDFARSEYRGIEVLPIGDVETACVRNIKCAVCPKQAQCRVYRAHKDGSMDWSSRRNSCLEHQEQQYPVVLRVRVKTTAIVLKDEKPMLGDGSTNDLVPEYVEIIQSFGGKMPVVNPEPKVERQARPWTAVDGRSQMRFSEPGVRRKRRVGESGRQWVKRRKKSGLFGR